VYNCQEAKTRPAPPKKPLRLSLHRAASLQSVESAPPATPQHDVTRKPTKRNHRGDPPTEKTASRPEINGNVRQSAAAASKNTLQSRIMSECPAMALSKTESALNVRTNGEMVLTVGNSWTFLGRKSERED